MIWSCIINYSGWDDDIHHHHFFLESDTKPTEEEVAEHYNVTRYNPNLYDFDEEIVKDSVEHCWVAKEEKDGVEYEARIKVEPLKIEKLGGKE